MSQKVDRSDQHGLRDLDNGLQALRQSPEFRGPAEASDDHHDANEHLALIYETRDEQFEAAIPFIRQGLERGERCLYVADENSREEVFSAMRARGVDVDAALDSGALSVHTKADTYLRTGEFDRDAMLDFWADSLEQATDEDGYSGIRAAAEMTWALDGDTSLDLLAEYEAVLNDLYEGEDYAVLCQYNRQRFPPEVIYDVVRTHPHLIHGSAVYENIYYTPPEEFFGPEQPANEVDRMMRTLRERSEAKAELENRHRYLRKQNEITASPDRPFEEKLQALFELGCDRFDLELGAMARVDVEDDWFEVEYVSDDHEHFEPGVKLPLSETYCTAAADIKAAGSVSDPHEEGYDDIHVYREFGIRAYLGTYVAVDGGADRTFFFVTSEPKAGDFTDDERTFIRLMGQWVQYELERRQREQFLRESYAITSDPAPSFEEKLERLLDLGREWFGLDMAALSQLPSWDGKFRLEKSVGLGVDTEDEPFWTDPGEGCFCRLTITEDTPVSQTDVRGIDWANDPIFEEFGLTSYLGTKVMSGSTPYGTLWFGSTKSRERPFSDTECAFIELMGQWVSYEIERREHKQSQRKLYEIAADTDKTFDEKLQALFELGCDRFDLELGGMARIDPDTDLFEVESVSNDHEHLEPGAKVSLSETYCRVLTNGGETTSITDPVADGFDGTLAYDEFGVNSYLGTRIELDDDFDRTLFFISSEPRNSAFSEAEHTFHHLMGQWVEYELERQQRERELRERTEHLSALIETTPECIKTVAADGTLLQMNPAGLDMGGADSESDVIGECVYDLIAPEHRERYRAFNERVCGGERGTLEFDVIGLEGTRRHMESHAAPLRRPDGTTVHVAVTRDVTEQVEREAELRQTKNRFETVFEDSDDSIFIIDPDADDLVDANPAAAEMTGYTRDELLSLNPSDLHSDEMEQFHSFLEEVQETGSAWSEDLHCRAKDGRDIPAEITASAITLEGRSLVLALVRDIEERKIHERYQRDLYEITANSNRPFDEKLQAVIELGCDRFDLEYGGLARIDPATDLFEVETINENHEHLVPGEQYPLSETYCQLAADEGETAAVTDPVIQGFEGKLCYDQFGVQAYLGSHLEFDRDVDRTFFFVSNEPRDEAFSEAERTFHHLMGQWVKHELEREHREGRLAGLNTLSRGLMDAETSADVCDRVAEAAVGALQMPDTAIALYDEQDGALRPAAVTGAAEDVLEATSPLAIGEGLGWNAFVENEQQREIDPLVDHSKETPSRITELVALPLGNHGVMLTVTAARDGFGSSDLDFVEAVTGNVTAALDRADREQKLQAREATLAEQNESLERLSRINDTIRSIDQALLQTSTRGEIEAVVCEQLATHGAYELAWIGEHETVTGEVTPRESAGADKGYLDQITVTADDQSTGQGPTGRAVQTCEPQVVNNILEDASYGPWRQAALNRGYHASIALPLVYKESLYGVLNVYAGRPNVFDDLEQAVLSELGETIAHAINAVESKKALVSDEITELEFTITDEELDLNAISVQTDCEISLESVIPQSDGRLHAFFSARGAPPAEVLEFAPRLPVSDVSLVSEHEEDGEVVGLFDALLTDESLCATVIDHGGVPRDVAVIDGVARVIIELAADAATNEFVEMITSKYPDSEVVAQRSRERSRKTRPEYRDALTDDLTERQLEVFQTAYFGGYFDKPRTQTGSEIAATLDITQPTFNHHVRAAQRKLCRHLFEEPTP